MMKKNSSIDKSLFVLIAKIGKTRGLKGEFFLRSFAEKLETLISFKKFFSLQSFIMEEIFFEYIKKSNNNIIAKLKSIDDIEGIKSFGQKDIYVLKSELPELEKNEAYWFELENIEISLILYFLSLLGFWGSLVYYNSYLNDIIYPRQANSVSAKGYTMV